MPRRPRPRPSAPIRQPASVGLALLLLGLLAGCAAAPPAEPGAPAGAVAVGPDLYQVPIGEDASGCPMYRLYSPSQLVSESIAWPRRGGGFTGDRREAAC